MTSNHMLCEYSIDFSGFIDHVISDIVFSSAYCYS